MQGYDGLRRNRKALLSDLSSLVKIAKRLQDHATGSQLHEPIETIFDEMLLKAFKIVTRGVRFLDVWNEEIGLTRVIEDLGSPTGSCFGHYDGPLTPPTDGSFSFVDTTPSSPVTTTASDRNGMVDYREQAASRMGMSRQSNPQSDYGEPRRGRPPSVQAQRISVSHRVSCTGPPSSERNPNLASERLGAAYDGFLGVLGSFIGLHLQSRSSTELILTTQQSVQSCRDLLSVVEMVWEYDMHRSEPLEIAKDTMYEKITELVHAAKDAFRPANASDDEIIFMPNEGKRLVDAATDCVRGAGDCVAKARLVLEQIGDFEFPAIGLGISTFDNETYEPPNTVQESEPTQPMEQDNTYHDDAESTPDQTLRPPPPPIQIPEQEQHQMELTPATPCLTDGTTPSTIFSSNDIRSPNSAVDPASAISVEVVDTPYSTAGDFQQHQPLNSESQVKKEADDASYESRAITSTGSNMTYASNMHDSGMSGLSQTSTRATSPDLGSQHPGSPLACSFPGSQTTLAESDETEENVLEKTFAHELMFKDGQIVGGSLRALVEKLTTHHSTPDALFVSTFYLTFRLFATPMEFAEALSERYDYIGDTPNVAGPVRLRVYNIFKGWLESHWRHDCDNIALDFVLSFARDKLMVTLPSAGKRLVELAEKVSTVHGPVVPRLVSSIGKTNTSIAQYVSPDSPLPPPILSKSQANVLKQWKNNGQPISILDFDPMELARQFTIKESNIFCSILPEELLATEWMKKSGSLAVNVRAMSTLSTDLANLVADCILQLEEPKKRAVIIKQWVKVANKCLELNNYDSLMAIICSLNSSTISRLRRTWELVSQKTINTLENLRSIVDVSRNYAVLRQRLQNHVAPCLPFVGTYLTDLTFVDHGNQSLRQIPTEDGAMTVINFDKHMKTAKIISELQRFQIPYRLTEIPELQTWMQDQLVRVRSAGEKSFQNYYRRSLVLEPREQQALARATPPEPTPTPSVFSKENAKDKFDFLAWTHSSKAKSIASNG